MFNYEKRLQYPVNITRPDAKAAQIIISQYGGPYSAGLGWDATCDFVKSKKLFLRMVGNSKKAKGSHCFYIHSAKPGKVTIPNHKGNLDPRTIKSIMKQVGL